MGSSNSTLSFSLLIVITNGCIVLSVHYPLQRQALLNSSIIEIGYKYLVLLIVHTKSLPSTLFALVIKMVIQYLHNLVIKIEVLIVSGDPISIRSIPAPRAAARAPATIICFIIVQFPASSGGVQTLDWHTAGQGHSISSSRSFVLIINLEEYTYLQVKVLIMFIFINSIV